MKTKKKIFAFKSAILLFMIGLISLISCSKDDPDPEDIIVPMYGVPTADFPNEVEN